MKLMIVIVQDEDAGKLVAELMGNQIGVTKLATTGGFLKRGNTTLLIGIDEARIDDVKAMITKHCQRRTKTIVPVAPAASMDYLPMPIHVEVGGATVFIMDCEQWKL